MSYIDLLLTLILLNKNKLVAESCVVRLRCVSLHVGRRDVMRGSVCIGIYGHIILS